MRRFSLLILAVAAILAGIAGADAGSTVDVPVLRQSLGQSDIIGEDDVVWVTLAFRKVPRNAITDASALIGMAPKRLIKAGEPVRQTDVAPPLVVKKGSTVVMIYERGGLLLTAAGRALHNAAVGESVKVENLHSEIVVEGIAQPDGSIEVGFGRILALD